MLSIKNDDSAFLNDRRLAGSSILDPQHPSRSPRQSIQKASQRASLGKCLCYKVRLARRLEVVERSNLVESRLGS